LSDPSYLKQFKKPSKSLLSKAFPGTFDLILAKHDTNLFKTDLASNAEAELHRDIRPLIRINILGTAFLAILDTGATFSVANRAMKTLFESFHYISAKDSRKFSTAAGLVTNTGLFKVPVRLRGMPVAQSARFYIIDDCPLLLLGRDFIRQFGIVFNLSDSKPYWTHNQTKDRFNFDSPLSPRTFKEAHFCKIEQDHKNRQWIKNLDLSKVGDLTAQNAVRKILSRNKQLFSDNPGISENMRLFLLKSFRTAF